MIPPVPRDIPEESTQDQVLKECEEYRKESRKLRDIACLKSNGNTDTGRINPLPISKKALRTGRQKRRERVLPVGKC
jgi:hypothetical protein